MTEKRATDRPGTLGIDPLTGGLRMGATAHPVADPTDPEQVYGAYLSLLYAVRGARRGEEIPLRSTDLDALLTIVGEDVELIERRLVELMGCTAEEATLLRRVLVRHRNLAASVGAVAGLSLVALLGPSVASATPAPAPSPSPAAVTPADTTELPPLTTYLTTDDGAHVPVPESWSSETAVEVEAPAEDVTAASVSPSPEASASVQPSASPSASPSISPAAVPSASASVAPSASPAASTSPSAPAVSSQAAPEPAAPVEDVVLGDPMAPIDRPGWSPEDEVVLGEPTAPIDRPGWSPEDEVVLGEAMEPIDRVDPNEGTPPIRWSPQYPVEPAGE